MKVLRARNAKKLCERNDEWGAAPFTPARAKPPLTCLKTRSARFSVQGRPPLAGISSGCDILRCRLAVFRPSTAFSYQTLSLPLINSLTSGLTGQYPSHFLFSFFSLFLLFQSFFLMYIICQNTQIWYSFCDFFCVLKQKTVWRMSIRLRCIFKFLFCCSTGRDAPLFSVLVLLIRWQRRAAFFSSRFVIQLVETHRFCLYCILRFRKNQGLELIHFFFTGDIFINQ